MNDKIPQNYYWHIFKWKKKKLTKMFKAHKFVKK